MKLILTSADDALPYPDPPFRPGQVVLELLYRPLLTRFMALARDRGAAAHGGLAMLLYQGCASFALWTGLPAPVGVMAAALERAAGLPPGTLPASP